MGNNITLENLLNNSPFIVFGDTDHNNRNVKLYVANQMQLLAKSGVADILLEISTQYKNAFEAIDKNSNHRVKSYQEFFENKVFPEDAHKEDKAIAYAALIDSALKNNISIHFSNDSRSADKVREKYPFFKDLHLQDKVASKISIEAREDWLNSLEANLRDAYLQAYSEWKEARLSINASIAEEMIQLRGNSNKKIAAIFGSDHSNREGGINTYIPNANLVHIYENPGKYGRDMELSTNNNFNPGYNFSNNPRAYVTYLDQPKTVIYKAADELIKDQAFKDFMFASSMPSVIVDAIKVIDKIDRKIDHYLFF